jgi:hypothetical protein
VTADRSPARYILELKLAEVPSGPLSPKQVMHRPRSGRVECDRAGGGFPFLRLRSPLPEESIGPCTLSLPGHACGRRLVHGTYLELARPARGAARAPEGVQVSGKNGPHNSDLDSVQSLPEQQPAHVSLRCLELGSSLCDR